MMADVRSAERCGVHSMGLVTALTVQSSRRFEGLSWTHPDELMHQFERLLDENPPDALKIGLIPGLEFLSRYLDKLEQHFPGIPIVWDPVLAPSAGGDFHPDNLRGFERLLHRIDLFTPNRPEMRRLCPNEQEEESALRLSRDFGCAVLLKGGHDRQHPGRDLLFKPAENSPHILNPGSPGLPPKRGSGCVLSTAIASNLASGHTLLSACTQAKNFTEDYLGSSATLIGTFS